MRAAGHPEARIAGDPPRFAHHPAIEPARRALERRPVAGHIARGAGLGRGQHGDLFRFDEALAQSVHQLAGNERIPAAQQIADRAALKRLERRHADPRRVTRARERHVQLAQVFSEALVVGAPEHLRGLLERDAQLAVLVVPPDQRVLQFDRTMRADERQEHERILEPLRLVDGDDLNEIAVALEANLPRIAAAALARGIALLDQMPDQALFAFDQRAGVLQQFG